MKPRTLIQVHYHNRPGGVSRVMYAYARAFCRLSDAGEWRNVVVCHDDGKGGLTGCGAEVVSDPLLDYRRFTSPQALETAAARLVRTINCLLLSDNCPRPVAVIGHNLALGKNCALTAAFFRCARERLSAGDDVRFFAMSHDLAEEGRVELLDDIAHAGAQMPGFAAMRYPALANVTHVVLNVRAKQALMAAGLDPVRIDNPLEMPDPRRVHDERGVQAMRRLLRDLARADHVAWDKYGCIALYPSRVIPRKNVMEAILLCCVARGDNLAVGGPGATPSDRRLLAMIQRFCVLHRLPVLFDCGRALRGKTHDGGGLQGLIPAVDYCVSTSVLEGFGFGLYEPWIYNKAVIGRAPQAGRGGDGSYRRLLIPADWIKITSLMQRYAAFLASLPGLDATRGARLVGNMGQAIREQGLVDFGVLDVRSQCDVVAKVIRDRSLLRFVTPEPRSSAHRSLGHGLELPSATVIHRRRAQVIARFAPAAFDRAFRRCFMTGRPRRNADSCDVSAIARCYAQPGDFSALL